MQTLSFRVTKRFVDARFTPNSWVRAGIYLLCAGVALILVMNLERADVRLIAQPSNKGGPLEVVSPVVLLMGSGLGLALSRAWRGLDGARYLAWLGYATLLWFLAMEELGWGYELLQFPRPEVQGIPVDSVHDLLRLMRRLGNRQVIAIAQAGLAGTVIVAVAMLLTSRGRRVLRGVSPGIAVLLSAALVAIIGALLLDTRLTDIVWFLRRNPQYELEELLELTSYLALCVVSLEGWIAAESAPRSLELGMHRSRLPAVADPVEA